MHTRNTIVLVLYNEQGEILLQHRGPEAPRLPNYWGIFGGGIEPGETPEQTLARESAEELEYRVGKPELTFAQEYVLGRETGVMNVFVEKYDPNQKLVLHEGQGMGWWKFDDLPKLLIADHDRAALAKVRKYLSKL